MTSLKGVLLTAAIVGLAACGGGDEKKGGDGKAAGGGAAPAGGAPAPAGGGAKYDAAASTASVKFTVKFTGAKPPAVAKSITGDTFCTEHAGASMPDERFTVNDNGTLPNAFVWALEGPHKNMTGFPEPAAFTLDQRNCTYVPHVFGLRAGQKFTVKNSDGTTHNVHAKPKANKEINQSQVKDQANEFVFSAKERAIPFVCDIHSWMSAVAFVLDHPFYGTTGNDGTVSISGLPAGKYKFKVWHEPFTADGKGMEADVEVEVKAGEAATRDVEMK